METHMFSFATHMMLSGETQLWRRTRFRLPLIYLYIQKRPRLENKNKKLTYNNDGTQCIFKLKMNDYNYK
jgi:hypothetical protein